MKLRDTHKYDDILYQPHPESQRHCRMSRLVRAAQFAPFAALTGFDGVLAETARLTDSPPELTEGRQEELDRVLHQLLERIPEQPQVKLCYFQPDPYKEGGAYCSLVCRIKAIDSSQGRLLLSDGSAVPIRALYDIQLLEA